MEKQPSKHLLEKDEAKGVKGEIISPQKTEDETEQEEPKTILKTETGNIDLTTILSLAFGGGITV
jgi:hypothetical protein